MAPGPPMLPHAPEKFYGMWDRQGLKWVPIQSTFGTVKKASVDFWNVREDVLEVVREDVRKDVREVVKESISRLEEMNYDVCTEGP